MKAFLPFLIILILAEAVFAQSPQERAAHEEVKNFTFADRYGGCDDADKGRWFLHFKADGSIRIGLVRSDKSRILKFHFDDEGAPHVDLSDVFGANPKWRRVGPFTLEIKNSESTHLFTLVPAYNGARFIKFFEVGGQGRIFEIGFRPEYELNFKESKEYR